MASSSSASPEQLAVFKRELVELLHANDCSLDLGILQGCYSKKFQKNISVKQYGISSIKQIETLFGDLMGVVTVGNRPFLRLLRQPTPEMFSSNESVHVMEPRGLSEKDAKRQTLLSEIVGLLKKHPKGVTIGQLTNKYRLMFGKDIREALKPCGIARSLDGLANAFGSLSVATQENKTRERHWLRLKQDSPGASGKPSRQYPAGADKQQLDTVFENLQKLLEGKQKGIRLDGVPKKYKKNFNRSLKSCGINDIGQVTNIFRDELEVHAIPKTKIKCKIYLKDAERFEDSGSSDDGDDSDGSESSDLMFSSPLPVGVKANKDAVPKRSLMISPSPKANVHPKQAELKKNLISLLQTSPEGIGLHCLHRAYEQIYLTPLTLAQVGIDSVDSLAVMFSDVFVVVSQCNELKHKFVRIRQSSDADTTVKKGKAAKNEQMRWKFEELLRPYPAGISLSNLSKRYSQKYRQSAPKNQVIMDTYKNDFVFFSKCNTEGHQFLKLKPNRSPTETSSKAKAQPYSVTPSTGPLQASSARTPQSYPGQIHQYGQVFEQVAQVNEVDSGGPGLLGSYPRPLMDFPLLQAPCGNELQRNPHKIKVAPQYEYSGRTVSWSGDPHLETEQRLPMRAAASSTEKQLQGAASGWAAYGYGRTIENSNQNVSKAYSGGTVSAKEMWEQVTELKQNVAAKQKEEQSKQKQQAEKLQKIQQKQQGQQSAIPKQRQQQQQPVRHQIKAAPRQKTAKQQDPNQTREDAAAQNIITNLAEANELVTVNRVVELLKQHFQVTRVKDLGVYRETDIPTINQLVRLQAKVNAFIQAFVKIRAICTLHELKECLAMVEAPVGCTDKLDYSSLELGPLVKQPLIWDFFKFPSTKDDSDIPKITTLDILENLRDFLRIKSLWRSKVKLEDFMEYLIKEYKVEGPWDLGVKINSLGLGIAAIKTAQRDQKNVMDHARGEIKTRMTDDAKDAMERIRKAVMSPADITGHEVYPGPQLELRRRYVNMSAVDAINTVFTHAIDLAEYDRDLHQFCLSLSRVVTKPLSRSLLQLALCSGDLKEPDDLPKGFLESEEEEEEEEDEEERGPDSDRITSKTQPTEDQVKQELVCYFNRLQHGIPNLKDLARIETKVCQHFGFQNFLILSRAKRTFLEFLSVDHPGVLESVGGTLMGLASGKPSQGSVYRPSRLDLVEFIRQCDPNKESEDILDRCLCAHYQVSTVEELGHGPVKRLSQPLIKMAATLGHYQQDSNAVIYETALCAANRRNESKNKEVGLFGSQRVEDALLCLQSAPLLEDLAEWCHWTMVFEPEHGDLKAFLERNPGLTLSPPIKINALEVRPGVLLRLATETSNDFFAAAAKSGDSINTVGHLVSLVVKDGPSNVPLALLSNHMETALNMLGVASDHGAVVGFILECLAAVPLQICVAVVRQVFLNPLVNVLGSEVKSRQLILTSCKTTRQKSRIQSLGLLLGISQWKDSFLEERMPQNMDNQQDLSGDEEEEFDVSSFLSLKKTHQAEERPPKMSENSSACVDDDVDTTLSSDEAGEQESSTDVQDEELEKGVKKDEDDEMVTEKVEAEIEEEDKEEEDAEITDDNEEEETTSPREELEGECSETSSTTSEKVTLESDDSSDTSESEMELPDDVIPPIDLSPFQESVVDCKKIVDSIRKEEFGIGMELDEDAQSLMTRHQQRIGRSLKRLSEELYSKDTHFVLELIQNADDNDYSEGVEPSLVFVVDRSEVMAMNNERGFSESNIRALCDVGKSTKGKHKSGYIGHKGIGFKSVFRVTDKPEIISKGYHVCFDHSSDPMGYILPTWVGPGDIEEISQMDEPSQTWTTQIKLPLKGDVQRTTSLVNKFADIQPSLLLFLNRLRSVKILNKDDNSSSHMSRKDIGDNVIEIRHSKRTDRWLLTKKRLDATKLQRTQIESTELGLAFPLSEGMSSEQNVFAFLPLRSYGFHFIIQGDFDIPSSREDVDADSAWNQWLLEEIPPLFTEALDSFKTHYHSDPIKAICQFLKFVPLEDQILTVFFKKVASDIHRSLKATPCMPVLTENEDEVEWHLPSETIMISDRLVLEVVSGSALKAHLNCSYLHPQVMSSIKPVLLKSLGVKVLQTSELLDILSSVVLTSRQSEYDISEETLQRLRAISMIPLSCGQVVPMEKASVFFPISEEDDQSQGQIQSGSSRPLLALEEDMSTLDSRLLNSLDKVSNSQIVQILEELGVRHISPGEVIQHHILPVIKSDQWKEKSRDVMVGYAVFIKDHLEKQPSVCDINEIAEWLHVVTNHGLIKPRERPVHFTVTYGNKIDLNKQLPGCDWVLLDSRYIFHSARQVTINDIKQWHSFFSKLGVLNYLAMEKRVITVKEDELEATPWADLGQFWSKPPGGVYLIHDSVCQELTELIQADLEASAKQTQRLNLLRLLQQEWSSNYAGRTDAVVCDQSGVKLTDTQSSFSIQLRTSSWLPSTHVSGEKPGVVFRRPVEVFLPRDSVKVLLSNHVPYMVTEAQGDAQLLQFIGVKTARAIDPSFIMSMLKTWCYDESSSDRTSFCTTLRHIASVYQYLEQNCRPQEIRDLFDDHRVVFTSEARSNQETRVPVQGLFVHKNMVYWKDPSGLQQKYKGLNNRIELGGFYSHHPDLERFFCGLINVDTLPTIKEYAELLVQCASDVTLPDNGRIKEEILVLYKMLGQKCLASSSSDRNSRQHDMFAGQQLQTNSASTQFIRRVLEDQPVFPTTGNKWVTLAERPLICDSSSSDLQKLFEDRKEVHLLNFGDRDRLGRVVDGVYKPGSMNRQHVQVFLEACGVGKLVDCIKEEFITELTKPSIPLQLFLYEICPYVQLFMSQSSIKDVQSAYEKLTSEVKIAAKLKIMRFLEAKKIEKVYRYQHDPNVFAKQNVNCGIQDLMEFYISTSISKSLQNNSDVRREVAKLFSGGSIDVQSTLFNFLGNLRLELGSQKKANKGIDERICQALSLKFPLDEDAEPWVVPKPIIPEDPPKMVVKPPQVKPEPEVKPVAAAALEGDEDEAAIYSWPPKSGAFGPTVKITKGAQPVKEDSVLNMWPPPKPPVDTLPSLYPQMAHQFTDKQQQSADGMPQEGTAASATMLQHQGSQEGMLMLSVSRDSGQGVGQGVARDGLPASQQRQPSGRDTRLPCAPELNQFISPQGQNVDTLGVVKDDEERYSSTSSVSEDNDDEDDNEEEISEEDEDENGTSEDEQSPSRNGQFNSPPRIQHSFATPQSSSSPKKFFLPQLTDSEAVTVEFEDVPYGTALQHSLADVDLHLGDDKDMSDVGRWGEKLVYRYLVEMAKGNPSVTVHWINEHKESGEPYDIIINHGNSVIYIEVKSTLRDQKELFEISSKEVAFAQAHQRDFHLYRVYNVGKTSAVRLCRVCNLADRMDKKEVKLFMLL